MQKISVIYRSVTGNTELLARCIRERCADSTVFFGNVSEIQGNFPESEIYFIGFRTVKGDAEPEIKAIFSKLNGKKVFLFGTSGIAGNEEYRKGVLDRAAAALPKSAEYLGGFICVGKLPYETALKYRTALLNSPNNQKLMRAIDNFDRAASHPNEEDLQALSAAVDRVLETSDR